MPRVRRLRWFRVKALLGGGLRGRDYIHAFCSVAHTRERRPRRRGFFLFLFHPRRERNPITTAWIVIVIVIVIVITIAVAVAISKDDHAFSLSTPALAVVLTMLVVISRHANRHPAQRGGGHRDFGRRAEGQLE